ncbi:MAG: NADH-quinone oxidoreductase subunit N [Acidimicrobiales bacterium]
MNENPAALIPEIALVAPAVIGLLAGSWLPRRRQWVVRVVAAAACLIGLAATAVAMLDASQRVFDGSYAIDPATNAARVIILAATLLVICLSVDTVGGHRHETEFYVLVLLASAGAVAMVGADDLLTLFAAYLLASVPSYGLVGLLRDPPGTEAALKYYLLGALLGIVMLTGVTALVGVAGTSTYPGLRDALTGAPHAAVAFGVVAVTAGLLFKIGGVPAQFWVPDAVDGASTPAAAFVSTIPKIGGLGAAWRLYTHALPAHSVDWALLAAIVAAASMTIGNLAAFGQTNVKRLLAYSTISQVGYLLMAVTVASRSELAQRALWYYLAAYAVTNLGAFAVVAELPAAVTIGDYRGMARRHPALAASLAVCLLGLVGTPPTAIFVGKLEIFTATINGGYTWLAVLAVANTVASLYYYLRWLAPTFHVAPADGENAALAAAGTWSAAVAYIAAAASLALGIGASIALPLGAGRLLS